MDKALDLLIKLLDNYSLATLCLGTFLVALSGMDKWPLGSITVPVSNQSRLVLLIIGLILTVVSILSLFFKEPFAKFLGITSDKGKLKDLEKLIQDIKALVESRNDETSLKVLDILNGVKRDFDEFAKETQESRLAVKWLRSKNQSLLQTIKSPGSSSQSLEEFRFEIQKYLDLLMESLQKGKCIAPRFRNINFHIEKPFPYVKALKELKKVIETEFNSNQDELNEAGLKTLNNYLDELVEVILKESSRS
ncbi:hypothetical protein [Planktothrix agardhii]|jgi:hypothetical protein|uniref:hypothetical protein n=1 Tax=Planktothrix agardhii TaxID=1160 RepID=UPI0020A76EC5|nr:hypothetical protein [Planktothrix agardhii]CAD5985155.1 hypothetical protein NO365_04472 [Planktothrix agardhii]